jgi:hypothetical protein
VVEVAGASTCMVSVGGITATAAMVDSMGACVIREAVKEGGRRQEAGRVI